MGSILNLSSVNQKDMDGFVQHLEPQACVGNVIVVFPPQLRCVKKKNCGTHIEVPLWRRPHECVACVPSVIGAIHVPYTCGVGVARWGPDDIHRGSIDLLHNIENVLCHCLAVSCHCGHHHLPVGFISGCPNTNIYDHSEVTLNMSIILRTSFVVVLLSPVTVDTTTCQFFFSGCPNTKSEDHSYSKVT
jgi:hypothetical protein